MKRRSGFTLIELLIVVAIIFILAAILLPVVFGAREAGLKATCISNMSQISQALAAYKQDYNVYPDNTAPMQKLVGAGRDHLGKVLTCPKDPVDKHDTYSEFYNYWGYQGGSLAPVALKSATDAQAVYATLTNPKTGKQDYWRAADATLVDAPEGGYGQDFPGLANPQVSTDTIVTICIHHAEKFNGKYIILRVNGSASSGQGTTDFYKPADDMFWALSKKVP